MQGKFTSRSRSVLVGHSSPMLSVWRGRWTGEYFAYHRAGCGGLVARAPSFSQARKAAYRHLRGCGSRASAPVMRGETAMAAALRRAGLVG